MRAGAAVKAISGYVFKLLLISIAGISIANADVGWHTYSKAVFQQAQASKKLILIYGYSPHCKYCTMMNSGTFKDARVINRINIRYIPVKVNTTVETETANYYGMFIVPTMVIVQPDGRIMEAIYGYHDADELLSKI